MTAGGSIVGLESAARAEAEILQEKILPFQPRRLTVHRCRRQNKDRLSQCFCRRSNQNRSCESFEGRHFNKKRADELSPDSGRKTGIRAQSNQLQDRPDKLVRINGFGQVCLEAGQPGPNPIFLTSCGCKSNDRQLSDVGL